MNKFSFFRVDWFLVAPVLVLIIISLTTLFSISTGFFSNQLLFLGLGVFLFLFFSHVDYRMLKQYTVPLYILSLIILFILLLIGIQSRGAIRWFDIFGFTLQFSEILKPILLVVLASFLSTKRSSSFKNFSLVLGFLVPVVFFIYRQPDLGNAIIYTTTTFLILLFYGFPLWWFFVGAISFAVIIPFGYRFLHPYQQQRLLTFFHVTNDPLGTSYNAIQSVIAVGGGMFFGKGIGQGTQSMLRFLPERHTDFIFATLSEMLGFFGSAIVIVAFAVILWRLWVLINRTSDTYAKLYLIGAFSLILIQFFINIGMNIGLVPIVGVTLPFVSYGGSSFLSMAILLGLASSVSSVTKRKNVLEIR